MNRIEPKFTFTLSAQKQNEPADMSAPIVNMFADDINDPKTYAGKLKTGTWIDSPAQLKAEKHEVATFSDELGVYPSIRCEDGKMIVSLWSNRGDTFLCNSAPIPLDAILKGNVGFVTMPFGLKNPLNGDLTMVDYKITVSIQDVAITEEKGVKSYNWADPSVKQTLISKYHNPPKGPQKEIPIILTNE